MPEVQKQHRMQVPKSSIYKAVTSFDEYADFLPEVVSATILDGASETLALVKFEIEVMKRFEYVLEFTMKPDSEVHWKLHESNLFKKNQGAWKFVAINEGTTEVHYSVEVEFGFMVPGWAVKKLTANSLPKMFDNFETKARELA